MAGTRVRSGTPRCANCGGFAFLDWQQCLHCGAELGYRFDTLTFLQGHPEGVVADGETWRYCSNRPWGCNWLVADNEESGRCFSCRLSRTLPQRDDTIAWEKLYDTGIAKRRLLVQLRDLGLPITAFWEREGGLGFDLLSSFSGKRVTIGHANGIITLDLAETLDAHREALRVRLGEPYRTMLGHFRHEIGHYYQWVLVTDDATWAKCRALFGDERASYQDAIKRHYAEGAPQDWAQSYLSEYATMHPWEDFAETFAHYLHISGTLGTAAAAGVRLDATRVAGIVDHDIVPEGDYRELGVDRMLDDWHWLSLMFNRVNRSMGQRDLYPFDLTAPVIAKLRFVHELITQEVSTGSTR
ncbi:putative zinc-binding metallopeptidase [soil metagenome]